jgi:hypothetical protein
MRLHHNPWRHKTFSHGQSRALHENERMHRNQIPCSIRHSDASNRVQAGDTVLGYDFTSAVFNDAETKEWPKLNLPDVLLVKKVRIESWWLYDAQLV